MAASMGMGREMIDWTKPIETVDGRAAKVLSRGYWRNGVTYCVVQFEDDDGNSEIVIVNPTTGYQAWSHKGPFRNVRVKREGWVNIYHVHETEAAAIQCRSQNEGVVTRFVRWEE
jgi:hypothetical protein